MAEVQKLRGLWCVLGLCVCVCPLCSQVFTSIFGLLSSGRWFFLCSRCSSLSRLVMNKCVTGEVCSRSLLSAPLRCCLLPRCSCQASTTVTSPRPIRQPFKLRAAPWFVEGGGVRLQQRSTSHCCPQKELQPSEGFNLVFLARFLQEMLCERRGRRGVPDWRPQSREGFKRLPWSFT